MHAWRIKLIDVKYKRFPMGSVLEVGSDIAEQSAYNLLNFGNAAVVNAAADEIIIDKKGVINEENLHCVDDPAADSFDGYSS